MSPGYGHVLVALDKFKGSLSSEEAVAAVAAGVLDAAPSARVRTFPVADGGDGTIDMLIANGAEKVELFACDAIGRSTRTVAARANGTIWVEMARTCGMATLGHDRREPWRSSSLGLGLAVREALALRPRRIVVALGGSASTDGGLGFLMGLGAIARRETGQLCSPNLTGMIQARTLDLGSLDNRLESIRVDALVDVISPLTGRQGTVAQFSAQKGLKPQHRPRVENAMRRWVMLLERSLGRAVGTVPGGGAAGGVGVAVCALSGRLLPGAKTLFDQCDFNSLLEGAALVITGEGCWDAQSLLGKAPAEVLARAARRGVPTAMIVGRIETDLEPDCLAIRTLLGLEPDIERSMRDAATLLRRTGDDLARQVRNILA